MFKKALRVITGYLIVAIGWLFLYMLWSNEIFNNANILVSVKTIFFWIIWGAIIWVTLFILRKGFTQKSKNITGKDNYDIK